MIIQTINLTKREESEIGSAHQVPKTKTSVKKATDALGDPAVVALTAIRVIETNEIAAQITSQAGVTTIVATPNMAVSLLENMNLETRSINLTVHPEKASLSTKWQSLNKGLKLDQTEFQSVKRTFCRVSKQ